MRLRKTKKTSPIELESVKAFANVTTQHEDAELQHMLNGCIEACERFGEVCINLYDVVEYRRIYNGNQKVANLENTKRLRTTYSPIVELTSLATISEEGREEAVNSDYYELNLDLGKFFFENTVLNVPFSVVDPAHYYKISYKAGYTKDDIPDDLKLAVSSLFSIVYETRGLEMYGKFDPLPSTVRQYLMPYKMENMNNVD